MDEGPSLNIMPLLQYPHSHSRSPSQLRLIYHRLSHFISLLFSLFCILLVFYTIPSLLILRSRFKMTFEDIQLYYFLIARPDRILDQPTKRPFCRIL